ncbi:Clavaminate synthase-like protein [Mytilinidion resinicola]|uniref:Clavaminate synthase-like protein n=1 Tax=Mytilinidion resinicola TaxID=574789 RepID=A0A6A6Z7N4_9PEZI|nr:Clavaminate synthase-like protein [Mytilinidion resinicola]KAF2816703.1 Clavaminate synthase-like protein [Mytilinidion resinicola]
MSETLTEPPPAGDDEDVFFHSGTTPTYRKVTKTPGAFTTIPTIDISALTSPTPSLSSRQQIAAQIYSACSMTAHVHKNPAIRGFEPMFETRLDPRTRGDTKEAFTMGDCPLEPEQGYISKIFALAFGLEETAFAGLFSRFLIWGMRARLHYPPLTPPPTEGDAEGISLGAHSDFSWLTLVLQDSVAALEILNKDGVWIDAPPAPGTFVCNVGQYLERQTAGRFVATVHRVRNKTGAGRYSLPFFLTPGPGARLGVLECCVEEGEERGEAVDVGGLYIRRVLPARPKHLTSIKYRDVPEKEWRYECLYG